jgi:hypothetical protein
MGPPSIDKDEHGTEKLLLKIQISEDFSWSSCYRRFRLFEPGIKSLFFFFSDDLEIFYQQVYCPLNCN